MMRLKHLLCSQFTQNSPPLQTHLGNDPKGRERLQATNICFFFFFPLFSGIANWFSNNSVLAFQEIKSLSPCQFPWCSYSHYGWNQAFSRKSPNVELGEVCTASFKSCPCVCLFGFSSGTRGLAPDSHPTCWPFHTHWAQHHAPGRSPASILPPFLHLPKQCSETQIRTRTSMLCTPQWLTFTAPRPCTSAFTVGLLPSLSSWWKRYETSLSLLMSNRLPGVPFPELLALLLCYLVNPHRLQALTQRGKC